MIRITLRGQAEAAKLLNELPQRLRGAVVQAFQDVAIQIQSLAKMNAPVFRGLLRVSIVQHVADEGSRIVGEVGSGLVYAPVIEEGRDQGWFPPPDALREWARKKLGDERLAFMVARAISRRGFKAQPYLGPALEAVTPRVEAIFQARIAEALGGQA
ncbi:MAG: HK97 gp10 family phage protein [Acidimicrobiales bacterium]